MPLIISSPVTTYDETDRVANTFLGEGSAVQSCINMAPWLFAWRMKRASVSFARAAILDDRIKLPYCGPQGAYILPKSILFLAQTRNSPTIEEQLAACAAPDDLIVEAGRLSLGKLAERLARKGMALQSGDRLKIYDLSCLEISTATLIRIFVKILRSGVSIEICRPGIRIVASENPSALQLLLESLDAHWRLIHGLKTHGETHAKTGRRPRLSDDQLAAIREMLARPGATTSAVARSLGIGRTTLFDFLKRHGVSAKRR